MKNQIVISIQQIHSKAKMEYYYYCKSYRGWVFLIIGKKEKKYVCIITEEKTNQTVKSVNQSQEDSMFWY